MVQTPVASLDAAAIRVHRKGAGPTLVLLHCLGVDHGLWDIAAAGLEDSFTLLSYDFPGHGETRVPDRGYSIEDLSRQLTAVLAREGISRAHVAGISLGGLVAQHFAATNPALVDRLVLIDTTPRYVDEARQMGGARASRAHGGRPVVDRRPLEVWFTDGFAARIRRPCAVRDRFESSGEGYALACEALGAADLRPLAASIRAPTLIFCGKDELPPFQDAAHWLHLNIKGARLEWLSPAKHASVLEQPQEFATRTRAFLKP
jgi:pimeloyl-ACP methyl ester carboxylesterase